jgi:hypothetical protein
MRLDAIWNASEAWQKPLFAEQMSTLGYFAFNREHGRKICSQFKIDKGQFLYEREYACIYFVTGMYLVFLH